MFEDFLGPAAEHKNKAKLAIKEKRFDDAWRHLNEQKTLYLKHANRSNFTVQQILLLDSTVHLMMGNLLRVENKHNLALIHIAYVYKVGTLKDDNKKNEDKLKVYYKRVNKNSGFEELKNGLDLMSSYDYVSVQRFVHAFLHN